MFAKSKGNLQAGIYHMFDLVVLNRTFNSWEDSSMLQFLVINRNHKISLDYENKREELFLTPALYCGNRSLVNLSLTSLHFYYHSTNSNSKGVVTSRVSLSKVKFCKPI